MRSGRARKFEIIFRPDTDEAPIPLSRSATPIKRRWCFTRPGAATMREGTPGEVVIMNHHDRQGLD